MFNFYCLYAYSQDLKQKKCNSDDDWERKFMFYLGIFGLVVFVFLNMVDLMAPDIYIVQSPVCVKPAVQTVDLVQTVAGPAVQTVVDLLFKPLLTCCSNRC